MPSVRDDQVILGRFGRTHGLEGWLRLYSETEPADALFGYESLFCRQADHSDQSALRFVRWKSVGDYFLVLPVGCSTVDEAKRLVGIEIVVDKAALPVLPAGEYYQHQLTGLRVLSTGGVCLGMINNFLQTASQDVFVVVPTEDSIDQKERYLPYLTDSVVQSIDIDAGLMHVDWDPEF